MKIFLKTDVYDVIIENVGEEMLVFINTRPCVYTCPSILTLLSADVPVHQWFSNGGTSTGTAGGM